MVMPIVSLTLIGLVMAAGVVACRRDALLPGVLYGIAGAWLGFIALGVPGLLIDVAPGDGRFVAIFGHVGAVVGAGFVLVQPQSRGVLATRRTG